MSGEREMILDSECDDYVSKPFNIREFLVLVERRIGGATAEMAQ